jgi:DNA integrity scanning protein DisA with diadenylate cyclase activity
LDHAASLIPSDAASARKATLQHRTANRKSINTGQPDFIFATKSS